MKKQFNNAFLTFAILMISSFGSFAQLSLNNGKHVMEVGGAVTSYYNQRFYSGTVSDHKKDRFGLRDAQIQLKGRVKKQFEYQLQFDIADVISGAAVADAENPGLMDAYLVYTGFKIFEIKVGYGKLPFSRSVMCSFFNSPYFQRPEMCRGGVFSMRDAGVTITKSFWKQRVNVYGGVYSGMGETILNGGDNDLSGNPEFVGRVDVAYPARYRYADFDLVHVPIPMFVVGLNGRYANRGANSGADYGIRTLDGQKTTYGIDISFQYQGLSAQFEAIQAYCVPNDKLYLMQGLNTTYFKAGGIYATLSYHSKLLRSVISARYDEYNPNDLTIGDTQKTMSFAYAYLIKGWNSSIKVQYWYRLQREDIKKPWTDDQLRIGWSLQFK